MAVRLETWIQGFGKVEGETRREDGDRGLKDSCAFFVNVVLREKVRAWIRRGVMRTIMGPHCQKIARVCYSVDRS